MQWCGINWYGIIYYLMAHLSWQIGKKMNSSIRRFYAKIFGSYQLINSLITLGMDVWWRKRAARMATASARGKEHFLDICSGTGQTAMNLRKRLPSSCRVTAADFSHQMIKEAIHNAGKKNIHNIRFTMADALHLPFGDNTFDVITISFATRNLDEREGHLLRAFREFHRVLKPGGCFLNLETSQPPLKFIRFFFHLYVRLTVKPIGWLISGSPESYGYLSHSIRSFHSAVELSSILKQAGFETVDYKRLLLGGVAIHRARKKNV